MNRNALLAVIALVLLASCEDTESTDAGTIVYENPPEGDGVIRFVARGDSYDGQGGLSCVPIEETTLEGSEP